LQAGTLFFEVGIGLDLLGNQQLQIWVRSVNIDRSFLKF
jgi:hypothetical protein